MTMWLSFALILVIWLSIVLLFPIQWEFLVDKENSFWVNKGILRAETADKLARFEKGSGFKILLFLGLAGSAICIWILSQSLPCIFSTFHISQTPTPPSVCVMYVLYAKRNQSEVIKKYCQFGQRFLFSTLLQKPCHKKQEIEECILKLCGQIHHQGTYTPLWGVNYYLPYFFQLKYSVNVPAYSNFRTNIYPHTSNKHQQFSLRNGTLLFTVQEWKMRFYHSSQGC